MGEIINKMIIVCHDDKKEIDKVREDAVTHFQRLVNMVSPDLEYDVEGKMISPILTSIANGEYSFIVMGDCSKYGQETATAFNASRERWLEKWEDRGIDHILEIGFGEGSVLAKLY